MYTPITKRVKIARHKSSVANEDSIAKKTDKKKKTETAQTAGLDGNLLNTTGTGTGSTFTPPVAYEGKDACEDPNSAACKEWKATNERCKKDPNAEGCGGIRKFEIGTIEPGESNFESKPVMQDAQTASRIDLMGPQELRGNTRAGKIAARNVKKASKQLRRMQRRFDNGKINQETLTAYKDELANTVARSKNIGQQATGMRNRYLSQTMDYDRDLTKGTKGGPVKAPEGTETEDQFKQRFNKELNTTTSPQPTSSNPQTTTTPASSFSEMLANPFQPIKLGDGALFSNVSGMFGGAKKSPNTFKMKGYGKK